MDRSVGKLQVGLPMCSMEFKNLGPESRHRSTVCTFSQPPGQESPLPRGSLASTAAGALLGRAGPSCS